MLSQTALHSMLSGAKAKGLGETLHVAQVYTTRGGWKGQADHHLRESNLKRVIKALPGGEALVTCHELEISLANQLGFKEQKRDDWGVANVVFNTEQARDTFIKGEGFSQDTTCKKASSARSARTPAPPTPAAPRRWRSTPPPRTSAHAPPARRAASRERPGRRSTPTPPPPHPTNRQQHSLRLCAVCCSWGRFPTPCAVPYSLWCLISRQNAGLSYVLSTAPRHALRHLESHPVPRMALSLRVSASALFPYSFIHNRTHTDADAAGTCTTRCTIIYSAADRSRPEARI